MDLSPNVKSEREISLKSALIIIGTTVIGVIAIGLIVGYSFFWNQFEDKTRLDRDMEGIKQYINTKPKDAKAHIALGNQLLVRGEKKEALKEFEKAYAMDKKDQVTRFSLGFAYRELGQYDKAIKMLEPLVKERPFYFVAQYNLGVAYHKTKQYNKALDAYKKALNVENGAADVYLDMAKTYAEMGNKREALANVETALKYVPDYQEALDFKKTLTK